MKRLIVLAALLALPAPASGSSCLTSECSTTSVAQPGSRYLYVRPSGRTGRLVVYDVVTRRKSVTLPPGLASADGRTYVTATSSPTETTVVRHALPSGRVVAARRLSGRYTLRAVSADGRRIVLQQGIGRTRLAVLDGLRVSRRVTLPGVYEVETISVDGNRLFLIHWRENGGYELQFYDFARRRLSPTPTFEADGKIEKMVGQASGGVATRNGRWLLTLYVEPKGGFIHALDLRRGVGHCVDLPATSSALVMGAAALVLSPDESRLYVANPLAGTVSTIDLRRPRIVRTTRFRSPLRPTTFTYGIGPNAAASPDGRTIAFSGNRLVWAYDVSAGRARGPYRTGSAVAGLAFAPQLVVLAPSGAIKTVRPG